MDLTGINSYKNYIDNANEASAQALKGKLNSTSTEATDDELMDACKSFEQYFVEQVMKGFTKTLDEFEDNL